MGLFFRRNMLELLGDFVLGNRSPLHVAGSERVPMGTQWKSPNFSPLMGVITTMMTDQEMIEKHPFSEDAQKIITSKAILSLLMNQDNDFSGMLSNMCKDNYKLSKKMAKVHIKNLNKQDAETLEAHLKAMRSFILIEDSLKKTRFEWIFGIAQIEWAT